MVSTKSKRLFHWGYYMCLVNMARKCIVRPGGYCALATVLKNNPILVDSRGRYNVLSL